MTPNKHLFSILTSVLIISSCSSSSDKHREEGKIFHAAPMSGGIGSLYFGLYDDQTYQICNSGGLGQNCYSAKFNLQNDTLTLLGLNKDIPLNSNRLLIIKYNEQDSNSWQDLKRQDTANSLGDVYQLDSKNKLLDGKYEEHFVIRLDNLKNYR